MQEELTSEQRLYLSIRKRNKSVADDISRARKTTVRGELSDLGSVYFYLYLAICSPPEDAYLLSPFWTAARSGDKVPLRTGGISKAWLNYCNRCLVCKSNCMCHIC